MAPRVALETAPLSVFEKMLKREFMCRPVGFCVTCGRMPICEYLPVYLLIHRLFCGEEMENNQKSSGLTADVRLRQSKFKKRAVIIISAALAATVLLYILSGRYTCSKFEVLKALAYGIIDFFISILEFPGKVFPSIAYEIPNPISVTWEGNVDILLWVVRIPRLVAAFFVGGGLAISGANYQATFRNPLVSESILGVSAGASLGACIGLVFSMGDVMVAVLAFCGGILAVAMTYYISRLFRGNPTLLLVLTGTVVASLFSSGVSILKYIAPSEEAFEDITFWLMGSFATVGKSNLVYLVPVIAVCAIVLYRIRWKVNVLALGDDSARALGVDTGRLRKIIIVASTLITAISVCNCGMIGWIGVVIPQITRMIVGPDMKRLVPISFFGGGMFLAITDMLCRTILPTEIPIGILTSILGAPVYLIMLRRAKNGWN